MKKLSKGEETLAQHIRADKLPEPEREYRFDSERRWRFDFAWPELMLAVEVQGGTHTNGRHNRHYGMAADYEKHNHAVHAGWSVLYFTTEQVQSGWALNLISDLIMRLQDARELAQEFVTEHHKSRGLPH